MSQVKPFRKLPECVGCLYYASDPHLLCAVHPYGVQDEVCGAFREDPSWSQFPSLDWVMAVDEPEATAVCAQSGEETQSPAASKGHCDHMGECYGQCSCGPDETEDATPPPGTEAGVALISLLAAV